VTRGIVPSETKEGRNLYHHFEAVLSEGDPAKDPLLLWTNNGPGGASLGELMGEIGPFSLARDQSNMHLRLAFQSFFETLTHGTSVQILFFMNSRPHVGFH